MNYSYLDELEKKSIYIIREAKALFKNPAILWSGGKDSTTMLYLIRKTFGEIPFPVIHIDTGWKFEEIYEFRDRLVKEWNFELIIARHPLAGKLRPNGNVTRFQCCHTLKTLALKQVIEKYNFDAIFVAIRRDEHGIRMKERYFSPRDKEFRWRYTDQDVELSGWGIFWSDFAEAHHVRIHPMLHWSEVDIWLYIKRENIPVVSLYFAKNGYRYRSIGCKICTKPIKSNAKTIDEIIEEIKREKGTERVGRAQDKEDPYIMQRLRALGYM